MCILLYFHPPPPPTDSDILAHLPIINIGNSFTNISIATNVDIVNNIFTVNFSYNFNDSGGNDGLSFKNVNGYYNTFTKFFV